MSSSTRYVNKPGGVLVHLDDGTVQHVPYGNPLPKNMSDGQAAVADRFSSTSSPKPESDVRAEVAARAQENAALAEGGQVGSSSSPVPGNYSELDTPGASRFVASLSNFPKEQAAVVVHEMLNANRHEVVDAAGDEAKEIAEALIEQAGAEGVVTADGEKVVVQKADTSALEAQIEELRAELDKLREGAITGQVPEVNPDDFTEAELREMADKAGVEVGSKDNKAEIADKLNQHNAEAGPSPAASPEG